MALSARQHTLGGDAAAPDLVVGPVAEDDDVSLGTDDVAAARTLLRRSLGVIVVVVVAATVALALVSSAGKASHALADANIGLVLLSFALYAVAQTCLMVIWQGILGTGLRGGFAPAAERGAWAVSQLGKYVPTGAMLIVARVVLAARAGAVRRIVLSSALYEFGCSLTAALLISAAAVGQVHDLSHSVFRYVVYAAPALLLASLHPRVFRPVANVALRKVGREPLDVVLPMSRVLVAVAAYVAAFAVAGLGIYCLAAGLVHVPGHDVWLVIASASVGYVASVVGFLLPAGLGARESGIVLALSAVMPTSIGLEVAVISRIGQIAVECLMAGGFAVLARRSPAPDTLGLSA